MATRYSAEQVQQILVKAMEHTEESSFSRSQLQEMATDLGISPTALHQAEQSLRSVPDRSPVRSPILQQLFHQHLKTYMVVNAFLLALNFVLSGTITWAIYPLLGWGMGLLLHGNVSPCVKTNE